MRTIRQGDRGEDVRDVQQRLVALGSHVEPAELSGLFGPSTERAVRAFQQRRGLLSDGKVGPETWAELVEAGYSLGDRVLYLRVPMFRGDDVRDLQGKLNALGFHAGREDGIFGERCDRAMRDLQRNVGMQPDGIVGPDTVHAMTRVLRPEEVVSGALVRENEALRRLNATLEGARVAIDAGHGPDDPGITGPTGLAEDEASFALAEALAAELARRGAEPFLMRERGETPEPAARARAANEWGAEACLSIHTNGHDDPRAEGSLCLYYGNEVAFSAGGQRLAELVQDELTARLGLKDGRTHPKSITLLRETAMPAVQVEPCFITNPREERLLREEPFLRDLAIAIAHGVERFFGALPAVEAPGGGGSEPKADVPGEAGSASVAG
jgi:N-acetylmuramoyl-L-alanine amidase